MSNKKSNKGRRTNTKAAYTTEFGATVDRLRGASQAQLHGAVMGAVVNISIQEGALSAVDYLAHVIAVTVTAHHPSPTPALIDCIRASIMDGVEQTLEAHGACLIEAA